jgi:hypothetical protein
VRVIRSFLVLLGIFFSCLVLLAPFLTVSEPWGNEIWLLEAIQELNQSFHLVPTLNGVPYTGPGPLTVQLLSLLPFHDLFTLRIVSVLLGCLTALCVLVFCVSLWGRKTGIYSALLTITSLGFILTCATINMTVIPASMTILSFLLFTQVYLKETNPWWYLLSYLLMCVAGLTGGWTPLAFFTFGIILFILFDLSPKRLLSIKLPYAVLIIGGSMVLVYVACWIFEGSSYAKSLFTYEGSQSFLGRLLLWAKYNLPWLFLVIPAWTYDEVNRDVSTWRSLLAPKTGYVLGLAVVLFSRHAQEGYALLSIPFGCIIIGYWMARGFLIRQGLQTIRTVSVIATGAVLLVSAVVYLSIGPITELSVDIIRLLVILGACLAGGIILLCAKKRLFPAMVILTMIFVLGLCWYTALTVLPQKAENTLAFARKASFYSPLLVYQNDLMMRGYAGYCGARTIVVSEKMVPIGEKAYLAVRTDDLKALIKDLNLRMHAYVISSYRERGTYALIGISPLTPLQ